MTAGYLLNRSPTRALDWNSPLGKLQEIKGITNNLPTIAHLRSYGCRAYAHIKNHPKLDRISPRAHIGFLVGYTGSNIWRIWIPEKDRVIMSAPRITCINYIWSLNRILEGGATILGLIRTDQCSHVIQLSWSTSGRFGPS